jgi:Crinkler effector protein N-terminal domain
MMEATSTRSAPRTRDGDLFLWCSMFDDDPTAFQIAIPVDNNIDNLKNMIKLKQRPTFDFVPASSLVLWRVGTFYGDHAQFS